jgi:hypothetical protein
VDVKDRIKNIQGRVEEVAPKISHNLENIKHYSKHIERSITLSLAQEF